MTQQYLIGELLVQLERLQAATAAPVEDVTRLRRQVEAMPVTWLAAETNHALTLADRLCWESLSRGDIVAFSRQAPVCADLRLFGLCAGLITDE
jgi:hypothetical protein